MDTLIYAIITPFMKLKSLLQEEPFAPGFLVL